jgi:hypothetical protein
MPRDSHQLRHLGWLVLVLAAVPIGLPAAPGDLFATEQPLVLRLEAPLRTILRQRNNPEYQRARIVAADEQGAEVAVDLRVRVRGKSRVRSCEFPPLLLNFPGAQPAGSPFEGENRLKLVTHCDASSTYEQYVRLERQVYRVLDLLTDASLRTRLVTVIYYDSERGSEVATKPGFLIEDEERFAERLGLTTVALERIDAARYDAAALAVLDVFQYFIGNTDWSALAGPADEQCCHNVVPFARADGVLLPVPYDFDSTGIVDAPYAVPPERLSIRTVRQRLYRGRCRDLAELTPVFARFLEQRAAIAALFTSSTGITERSAARARAYVDAFYAVLADPEETESEFRVNCER